MRSANFPTAGADWQLRAAAANGVARPIRDTISMLQDLRRLTLADVVVADDGTQRPTVDIIFLCGNVVAPMDSDTACQIYRCFCELPRLRILNLLRHGPLCVCHLQEILQEPQVKISKHLAYLRTSGLVECRRRANWSIYSLASRPSAILEQNLKCLQDLQSEDPVFKADFKRLRKVDTSAAGCA